MTLTMSYGFLVQTLNFPEVSQIQIYSNDNARDKQEMYQMIDQILDHRVADYNF